MILSIAIFTVVISACFWALGVMFIRAMTNKDDK